MSCSGTNLCIRFDVIIPARAGWAVLLAVERKQPSYPATCISLCQSLFILRVKKIRATFSKMREDLKMSICTNI